MKTAIGIIVTATLLAGVTPARAQNLEGTLKKVKETGTFTIGHRDSSIPLSYLDDKLQPIGFSIELCKHVVEAVKAKLAMPNLSVKYNPVTSATRLPLVANGTVDIECGSTANMTSRQAQVGFSYTFFVPQFKWIARTNTGIKSADDLRGKTVAVTAGTNTALFVNKPPRLTTKDHGYPRRLILAEIGGILAGSGDHEGPLPILNRVPPGYPTIGGHDAETRTHGEDSRQA